MTRLAKSKIQEAVFDGIESAHRAYCKMSGWESLWYAPEQLLACQIAKKVASLKSCYLTLEDNVRDTMEIAGANGAGKPRTGLRKDGRFDIVVWWQGGEPRAVVEVKHPLYGATSVFKKDVVRIRDLLIKNQQTDGSFQFGCFAFWTGADSPKRKHESASHRIEENMKKIFDEAKRIVGDSCEVSMRYKIHKVKMDEWAWAAVVIVFEQKLKS